MGPHRRNFLWAGLIGAGAAVMPAAHAAEDDDRTKRVTADSVKPFELDEVTISELQEGMSSGKYTASSLTEKYLARIDAIDKKGPAVNSVIEINPDASAIAKTLDTERKEKG